jgi:NitT/TauT family transport system substrate-binding protein
MNFLKRRRYSAIFVAALFLAVAGCSGPAGSQGSLERVNITVDDFPSIDSAGLYIADMDGYFKAHGLNVTIDYATTRQAAVTGQEKGVYDVSSVDYVTYFDNELLHNAQLRIIAGASILQQGELSLLIPSGSKIKSVKQLAGSTLAVAAPGDIETLLIDSLLADNAVPVTDVHFKTGVPLQAAPQLLSAGGAAAAPVPEPFASEGEQKYGLQQLADLDQGGTANFPIQGFAVTKAWADKYPNTLRAFVAALTEGQQVADTDRSAVERAIEKFLHVSPLTAAVISLPNFPLSVDPQGLQRMLSTMIKFGFLPAKDSSFRVNSMIG